MATWKQSKLAKPPLRVARAARKRLQARSGSGAANVAPASIESRLDDLQQAIEQLTEAVAQQKTPAKPAKDRSGLRLKGKSPASVNPYEQELEKFQARYALTFEQLRAALPDVRLTRRDLSGADYDGFLERWLPDHEEIAKRPEHKKKQELFISFSLLRTGSDVSFLDAAGGGFSYLRHIDASEKFLQDLEIRDSVRKRVGRGVTYIEDSLGVIPLPDGSVDSISCHHAFEHFQGSVDSDFVREVQRVLAPGGSACIVPIFISTDYVEMTCFPDFDNWSGGSKSVRVVDPKSTLPGQKSGGFARVYDAAAFHERVVSLVDLNTFSVEIVECTIDGKPVPNPAAYFDHKVSNFNFPYRALMINRAPAEHNG